MLRRLAILSLLLCVPLVAAVSGGRARSAASPLTIGPIESVFVPGELATKYTVEASDRTGARITYHWFLTLALVDPAGAPAPGIPGSGAAVDAGCNNSFVAGGEEIDPNRYLWDDLEDTFVWYHGDHGAYPGSTYGCDHTKMGPSGHQGIVEVWVDAGPWRCSEHVDGTNLGAAPQAGGKESCTKAVDYVAVTLGWIAHAIASEEHAMNHAKGRKAALENSKRQLLEARGDLSLAAHAGQLDTSTASIVNGNLVNAGIDDRFAEEAKTNAEFHRLVLSALQQKDRARRRL